MSRLQGEAVKVAAGIEQLEDVLAEVRRENRRLVARVHKLEEARPSDPLYQDELQSAETVAKSLRQQLVAERDRTTAVRRAVAEVEDELTRSTDIFYVGGARAALVEIKAALA